MVGADGGTSLTPGTVSNRMSTSFPALRRHLAPLVGLAVTVAACGGTAAAPTTTAASTTTSSTTTTSTSTTTTSTTTTTTLPPTTTTTTEPEPTTTVPIDPQFALLFDGFERFGRLGDDATAVIDALTTAFGDPAADSDWKEDHTCSFEGSLRTVSWSEPGLVRVVFGDGESDYGSGEHLITYNTLLPGFPLISPWRLFGLTQGMFLPDVETLFPDAEVIAGVSLDYVQFDPEMPSYAFVYDSGEIRDFWGGTEYCWD